MAKIPGPPEQRRYTLQHMWEKHHQMARLLLLGLNNIEVAEALNCSPQNVSDVRNSPVFQEKMLALRGQADHKVVNIAAVLAGDSPKSVSLLQGIRDGELTEDIRLRAQVAQDLLDRAGHSKIVRSDSHVSVTHLDAEAIDRIKSLARGFKRNDAVDAQLVEEAAT